MSYIRVFTGFRLIGLVAMELIGLPVGDAIVNGGLVVETPVVVILL